MQSRIYFRNFLLCLLVFVCIVILSNYDTVIKCAQTIHRTAKCNYGSFQAPSYRKQCNSFHKKTEDNFCVVLNYQLDINQDLQKSLKLDTEGIDSSDNVKPAMPVLVTGASQNHFDEAQALFENIHLRLLFKYRNLKIIFYDLGLNSHSRKLLQKHCKCEVRTFDFKEYPRHVSALLTYTWKPIIIQLVLIEYSSVIWIDASIRFINPNFESFFFNSTDVGIKVLPGRGSIAHRTQLETFDYLGEDPCLFDVPELETGVVMLIRNKFTLRYIMLPWVSCALTLGCMTHPCSTWLHSGACTTKSPACGCCHRFDQSVLGIILTRLFHNKRQTLVGAISVKSPYPTKLQNCYYKINGSAYRVYCY